MLLKNFHGPSDICPMGFIYSIQSCEISHQTFGPSHRKCPTYPMIFVNTEISFRWMSSTELTQINTMELSGHMGQEINCILSMYKCRANIYHIFFTADKIQQWCDIEQIVLLGHGPVKQVYTEVKPELTWARFLCRARSKLRLCSANHRPGYWSNLPCDWPSTAWAYSEQETDNGPWSFILKNIPCWWGPYFYTATIVWDINEM